MAQNTQEQDTRQVITGTSKNLATFFASAVYSDEKKVELATGVNRLIIGLRLPKGPR